MTVTSPVASSAGRWNSPAGEDAGISDLPPPRLALSRWLHRATVEQWLILEREHAARPPASGAERAQVLGMYGVGLLVLLATHYWLQGAWRLLPDEIIRAPNKHFLGRMWWAWFTTAAYVVPPWLYARYVMGLRARDLGLSLDGLREHAWIYITGLAVVLPFVVAVAGTEGFQATYPFFRRAGEEVLPTVIWELSYAAQFFGVEFFFRGFLLFAAVRVLGPWCIPAMVLCYTTMHLSKPAPECLGAIAAGLTLGIVALRTRSIAFGVLIHTGVAWSMDALAIWHRSGGPQ